MIRSALIGALLALCACGGAAADDTAVPPGGTASYVSDGGRAEVLVTYPDGGIVRGANRFRFRPQGGAKLVDLAAMMPAHGHRTTTGFSADGDVVVADIELSMPGRWELTAGVETDGGSDQLRFSLIVP